MDRYAPILLLCLLMAVADPATAQDAVGRISDQLQEQGFARIEVHRTLLGRSRILATNAEGTREIIVNPGTGEILRDLWRPVADGEGRLLSTVKDKSGSDRSNDEAGSDRGASDVAASGSGRSGGNSGSGSDDGNIGSSSSGSGGSGNSDSSDSGSDDSGSSDSGSDDSDSSDSGSDDSGGSDSSGKDDGNDN